MPIPPPVARKLQRGTIPTGTPTAELLAIANRPTSRSAVLPLGTATDGAVMLVELVFPSPLLASTTATLLTPEYAAIPPAASLPVVNVQV
jgi:hypothetical protein